MKTEPLKGNVFAEGLSISVGKKKMAEFGVLKKYVLNHFDISQEVLYADLNWDLILEGAKTHKTKVSPISRFPEVRRDFALLVEESITYKEIEDIALQT